MTTHRKPATNSKPKKQEKAAPKVIRVVLPDGSIAHCKNAAEVRAICPDDRDLPAFTIDDPRIDIPDLTQRVKSLASGLSRYEAWVEEHGMASTATLNGMLSLIHRDGFELIDATGTLIRWKARAVAVQCSLEAVVESLHEAANCVLDVFTRDMDDETGLCKIKLPAQSKKPPRFPSVVGPQLNLQLETLQSWAKQLAPTDVRPDCVVNEAKGLTLTDEHVAILRCLSKQKGRPIQQADLLEALADREHDNDVVIMCKPKLGALLAELRRHGLVDRPRGDRSGDRVTPAGIAALKQFDNVNLTTT